MRRHWVSCMRRAEDFWNDVTIDLHLERLLNQSGACRCACIFSGAIEISTSRRTVSACATIQTWLHRGRRTQIGRRCGRRRAYDDGIWRFALRLLRFALVGVSGNDHGASLLSTGLAHSCSRRNDAALVSTPHKHIIRHTISDKRSAYPGRRHSSVAPTHPMAHPTRVHA